MPLQVYRCPIDGEQDILMRTFKVPSKIDCPTCGKQINHTISAPAVIDIKRDWNENANEYRRDPYTQAKAQINNRAREDAERGIPLQKVNEEGIQAAAKGIHEEKYQRLNVEQKAKRNLRNQTIKKEKK